MKKISEDLNQIIIVSLLKKIQMHHDFIFFHVPNGGSRNKAEAGKLKAMGVLAGVPDLQIIGKEKIFFIELKVYGGVLSAAQVDIHAKINALGFKVYTVYGDNPQEVLPQIKDILETELHINGISSQLSEVLNSCFVSKIIGSEKS